LCEKLKIAGFQEGENPQEICLWDARMMRNWGGFPPNPCGERVRGEAEGSSPCGLRKGLFE